jgi:hypothetical protein
MQVSEYELMKDVSVVYSQNMSNTKDKCGVFIFGLSGLLPFSRLHPLLWNQGGDKAHGRHLSMKIPKRPLGIIDISPLGYIVRAADRSYERHDWRNFPTLLHASGRSPLQASLVNAGICVAI